MGLGTFIKKHNGRNSSLYSLFSVWEYTDLGPSYHLWRTQFKAASCEQEDLFLINQYLNFRLPGIQSYEEENFALLK